MLPPAQRNLDGFADGAGFHRLVGGADVGVGGAAHAQDADDRAHQRADNEGDAAGLFNEQAEYQRDDDNDDRDRAELRTDKDAGAAADDAGQLRHFRRAFAKLLDVDVIVHNIRDAQQNDRKDYDKPSYHMQASFFLPAFPIFGKRIALIITCPSNLVALIQVK